MRLLLLVVIPHEIPTWLAALLVLIAAAGASIFTAAYSAPVRVECPWCEDYFPGPDRQRARQQLVDHIRQVHGRTIE